jgi:hypothetical protein
MKLPHAFSLHHQIPNAHRQSSMNSTICHYVKAGINFRLRQVCSQMNVHFNVKLTNNNQQSGIPYFNNRIAIDNSYLNK